MEIKKMNEKPKLMIVFVLMKIVHKNLFRIAAHHDQRKKLIEPQKTLNFDSKILTLRDWVLPP